MDHADVNQAIMMTVKLHNANLAIALAILVPDLLKQIVYHV
jgi:hypothetical protein